MSILFQYDDDDINTQVAIWTSLFSLKQKQLKIWLNTVGWFYIHVKTLLPCGKTWLAQIGQTLRHALFSFKADCNEPVYGGKN